MSLIEPKKALAVDYAVPPTRRVSIRVAATETVNVYAMTEQELEVFKARKNAPVAAFAKSEVGKEFDLLVDVPFVSRWYLVIHNPWDKVVDVNYTVTAYAPVLLGGTTGATGPSGPAGLVTSYVTTGSKP